MHACTHLLYSSHTFAPRSLNRHQNLEQLLSLSLHACSRGLCRLGGAFFGTPCSLYVYLCVRFFANAVGQICHLLSFVGKGMPSMRGVRGKSLSGTWVENVMRTLHATSQKMNVTRLFCTALCVCECLWGFFFTHMKTADLDAWSKFFGDKHGYFPAWDARVAARKLLRPRRATSRKLCTWHNFTSYRLFFLSRFVLSFPLARATGGWLCFLILAGPQSCTTSSSRRRSGLSWRSRLAYLSFTFGGLACRRSCRQSLSS